MLAVEPQPDADRPTVVVTTEDAIGEKRRYRVALGPEELDGDLIMESRRIDDGADGDRVEGASQAAYAEAREHFEARGHEVF